jgi:beta-galactosidase/beta-glucuronidase
MRPIQISPVLSGIFLASCLLASAARIDLDLSGAWQYQKVAQLSYPPPATNWQNTTVPGYLNGWQYERAWFRTTFSLPALPAGTRVKLRFGGVKFASQMWVNGVSVGGYLNGYEPFELDITQAAVQAGDNELVVGLTDWTGTFSQTVDFSNLGPYENPRDHATNALLAPIGGYYNLYGIWQPVSVRCLPPVSISDVFVMPSVRSNRLAVSVNLRNEGGSDQSITLAGQVLDGSTPVLSFPDLPLTIAAGSQTNATLSIAWTNAILWSHLSPRLYTLHSSISNAAGGDQLDTRFGFRELWRSGGRFILNGTPVNLLATATWPPQFLASTSEVQKVFQDVKAGNAIAMRLHTQPWDEKWYDIADEQGLLIVEEAAVWCDAYSYRLGDPRFWTNYSRHLAAAIKRDRNHPSIVIWSLENELLSVGGFTANSNSIAQLAALGGQVRAADPTRLITYESDLDPGGATDVLGLHYPHEFPDFQVWPDTAYWMDQPIDRNWMPGGKWKWDQSKPLYIGEFLWVPATSASMFSILFGDDAYADTSFYRNQAKALTWRMQIEAYRSYGVSGMAPWTLFEDPAVLSDTFDINPQSNTLYQAQKAAYEPNAVFLEQYSTRYFPGRVTPRAGMVYNDTMAPANVRVNWRIGNDSWQSAATASLAPAGRQRVTIPVLAPSAPGPFTLQLSVTDDEKNALHQFNRLLLHSAGSTHAASLDKGRPL